MCAGGCGRTFGGLTAFDTHRISMTGKPGYDPEYDWRCATDAELSARGLSLTSKGVWSREAPAWIGTAPRAAAGTGIDL